MGTVVSKGRSDKATPKNIIGTQTTAKPLQSQESVPDIDKLLDSMSIIEEKERKRQREQTEPETQVAITEAEKMLEIYRKEMKSATGRNEEKMKGKPESGDQVTVGADNTQFYNKPMQDIKRFTQRTKTPEYENHRRETTTTPNTKQENTMDTTKTILELTWKQKIEAESQAKSLAHIKEQGSIRVEAVAQRHPNLLDQRPISEYLAPLKPLDRNSMRFQKQKVRSELESQGILAPGSYEKAVNQSIIGELEEAGILLKGQKYTLSSGTPVRRPPPRVNQLPPLNKRQANSDEEPLVEFGKPEVSVVKGNGFDFVDHGRQLLATAGDGKLQGSAASFKTAGDPEMLEAQTPQQIGDANELKIKLFALDTL